MLALSSVLFSVFSSDVVRRSLSVVSMATALAVVPACNVEEVLLDELMADDYGEAIDVRAESLQGDIGDFRVPQQEGRVQNAFGYYDFIDLEVHGDAVDTARVPGEDDAAAMLWISMEGSVDGLDEGDRLQPMYNAEMGDMDDVDDGAFDDIDDLLGDGTNRIDVVACSGESEGNWDVDVPAEDLDATVVEVTDEGVVVEVDATVTGVRFDVVDDVDADDVDPSAVEPTQIRTRFFIAR